MKRRLLLLLQPACICVLIACAMEEKENWKDKVAGTYTTQYEQLYSNGFDTLFITKMKNGSGSFHIRRHTGYQRKGAAETAERIFKTDNWVGVADKIQPLLHIVSSGRKLWFDVTSGALTTSTTTYYRLQ